MTLSELVSGTKTKPKKKKAKKGASDDNDAHQQELENKKWNQNVETELTKELKKNLPDDSSKDSAEQAEARELLMEHEKSATVGDGSNNGKEQPTMPRKNRLCGQSCGMFKEVIVTADGFVLCNCEQCNENGWCPFNLIFGLVETGATPPIDCRDVDGVSWGAIRKGWKKELLSTVFQGRDEEAHAKCMHDTYLPTTDQLFDFASIVKAFRALEIQLVTSIH